MLGVIVKMIGQAVQAQDETVQIHIKRILGHQLAHCIVTLAQLAQRFIQPGEGLLGLRNGLVELQLLE